MSELVMLDLGSDAVQDAIEEIVMNALRESPLDMRKCVAGAVGRLRAHALPQTPSLHESQP